MDFVAGFATSSTALALLTPVLAAFLLPFWLCPFFFGNRRFLVYFLFFFPWALNRARIITVNSAPQHQQQLVIGVVCVPQAGGAGSQLARWSVCVSGRAVSAGVAEGLWSLGCSHQALLLSLFLQEEEAWV